MPTYIQIMWKGDVYMYVYSATFKTGIQDI